MVEFNDQFKEIKGIKLIQNTIARSADKAASITGRQYYSVSAIYFLEIKKSEPPLLTLDMQFNTSVRPDELDSVMFFELDNENVRIATIQNKKKQFDKGAVTAGSSAATATNETDKGEIQTASTTYATKDGSYKLMSRQFTVPENLWISIANTAKIRYRLYIGKEGIDVKFNTDETTKLKEYFFTAMRMRDASLPPVPSGQKKW